MYRNNFLCVAVLLCLQAQANADLITYKFTGKTTYFDGIPGSESFHGQFTYDTSILDSSPESSIWDEYRGALVDFRVQSGAFQYQLSNHAKSRRITISNSGANFYLDSFEWVDPARASSSYDLHNVLDIFFQVDPIGFIPGTLPTELKLAESGDYGLMLSEYWALSATNWDLFGKIESLERVPEPASILIMSTGAFGLFCIRKRFARQ